MLFQSVLYKQIWKNKDEKSKDKITANIEKLYSDDLESEDKALYYLNLWQLSGDILHKEKSLKLYKALNTEKPSYFFKKHIAQLEL